MARVWNMLKTLHLCLLTSASVFPTLCQGEGTFLFNHFGFSDLAGYGVIDFIFAFPVFVHVIRLDL